MKTLKISYTCILNNKNVISLEIDFILQLNYLYKLAKFFLSKNWVID